MQTSTLEGMEARYLSLEDQLSDPSVIADQNRWRALSKEHAELGDIVAKYREYKEADQAGRDAKEILEDKSQADLHELAKEDLKENEKKMEELDLEIHKMLIPKDPNDGKNVILEIRAGTGGEEAALFAADLLKMYIKFAERKGWKLEIANANETDLGGFKEVTCTIEGKNAYSILKFESGVHLVQRIPETESQGRVHTSAVTVAVLPEAEDVDVDIRREDLRIDVYRSSGAGGQHVNKTESAVRITHVPTNTVVACQTGRSQHANRDTAMKMLRAKLYELEVRKRNVEKDALEASKSDIGWGSQIRNYVLDQSRIKDLRTGIERTDTQKVLDGDLDEFIEASLKSGLDAGARRVDA